MITNSCGASRLATVGLCVAGVLLAALIKDINEIWGLITMGLGLGLFVPLFLRWYWPRFNGYGFAAGTGCGMGAAIVFKVLITDWPLYHTIPSHFAILQLLVPSLVPWQRNPLMRTSSSISTCR